MSEYARKYLSREKESNPRSPKAEEVLPLHQPGEVFLARLGGGVNEFLDTGVKNFNTTPMPRNKRTSLSRSIADLAANMPAMVSDHVVEPDGVIAGIDPSFSAGERTTVSICKVADGGVKLVKQEEVPECDVGEVIRMTKKIFSSEMLPLPSEAPTTQVRDSQWDDTHLPPLPPPSESSDELFRRWYLTPEGRRVTDTRIPTDPIRLRSILDDNARMVFMAGYAAANPGFE